MNETGKIIESAIHGAYSRHYRSTGLTGPALSAAMCLSTLAGRAENLRAGADCLKAWSVILRSAASALDGIVAGRSTDKEREAHKIQCEAFEQAAQAVENFGHSQLVQDAPELSDPASLERAKLARDMATTIRSLGSYIQASGGANDQ